VETDENDNLLASPITITEVIKNDLYVTNTSITAQSGNSISVSSRYYYSGNQTSSQLGSVYLGYYLSTDRYLSSDDIILDSDSSGIGTDDLYDSESETMNLPSDLDSGDYYILFVADYLNSISETNENNNISYESFSYTGGNTQNTDDIYITNMSVNQRSGNIYRAYLHQRYSGNTTNAILNNPDIIYVFSKDSILDINDVAIGRDSSTIGSDDTYDSEYIDFDITDYTTSSGTYYILFYVDYNKEVIETNENNNSGKVSFNVN
jgi:subtilase family serine protease